MTKVVLSDMSGGEVGELANSAEELILVAEETARKTGNTKRQCLADTFRKSIVAQGYSVTESRLQDALRAIDDVRAGRAVPQIAFVIEKAGAAKKKLHSARTAAPKKETRIDGLPQMTRSTKNTGFRFFENERLYPDNNAAKWFDRLVGIDQQKQELLLELELLLQPDLVEQWSRIHHDSILPACEVMAARAPLIVLEGDVGCGKTVLAESVGDPLARKLGCHVHLLKINTQVRGTGMVGEMTDLIAQAFSEVEDKAKRNSGEPVLLLIDEADSLASKRGEQHMHHEDKAGVNTLLQRIDRLRGEGLPVAVIFITNRHDALDSAVRRRAAASIRFERPDSDARAALFESNFPQLALTGTKAKKLVAATGANGKGQVGFTASDITDRLIPNAIKQAYLNDSPITAELLIATAESMESTPSMEDG